MSSESIGDAFLKTVIISCGSQLRTAGRRRARRSRIAMFSDRRHHRRHRDAAGPRRASASCASAGRERCDDRAGADADAREPLESAPRDAHATRSRQRRAAPIDQRRRHLLPGAALLHRRGRRRDQRAWQSGAPASASSRAAMAHGARLAEPGEFTLRAYPQRADRSRAGGGGRGSRSTR